MVQTGDVTVKDGIACYFVKKACFTSDRASWGGGDFGAEVRAICLFGCLGICSFLRRFLRG